MLELGVGILTLIGILLGMYVKGKPKRSLEDRKDEIQKGREAIKQGDVTNVTGRIDNILLPPKPSSDGSRRLSDPESIRRRLAKIIGK